MNTPATFLKIYHANFACDVNQRIDRVFIIFNIYMVQHYLQSVLQYVCSQI